MPIQQQAFDAAQGTSNGAEARPRTRRPAATTVDIWPFSRGQYKVYVEDTALKDRIAGWQDCRVHCVYHNRRFQVVAWDIIFPSRLYDRVAQLCGLPPKKKSPGRVAHGKRLGAWAKRLGHVGVQNRGDFPIVRIAQNSGDTYLIRLDPPRQPT